MIQYVPCSISSGRQYDDDLIDIPDLTEEEMAYAMDDFFGHRWMDEYLTLGEAWSTALYRDAERLAGIARELIREREITDEVLGEVVDLARKVC